MDTIECTKMLMRRSKIGIIYKREHHRRLKVMIN